MNAQLSGAARRVEATTSIISLGLSAVALILLPWPGLAELFGPQANWRWFGACAALEGAWLVALLPGMLAGVPTLVRSSMRSAQIGLAGRAVTWLAAGAGLALGELSWRSAPAALLIVVAVAAGLPIALGWGPFGSLPGFRAGATDQAIDPEAAPLVNRARQVRQIALIVASFVFALPLAFLPALAGWALLVAACLFFAFALSRLEGQWPRLTLPAALRFCWSRAFPLAVAAIIYVVILSWA
jgi:hypothetical protein